MVTLLDTPVLKIAVSEERAAKVKLCPTCGGMGSVAVDSGPHPQGGRWVESESCWTCRGRGIVEK